MKKQNYPSARSQRRATARRVKENVEKTIIVMTNEAFSKIHPELVKLGWLYEEQFGNVVELHNKLVITESPALRLVTDIYNVTIIPHQSGCEISRLEVWEEFQNQGHGGRFLDNLLGFLYQIGIKEIYVLPMPAGLGKSQTSLSHNTTALQSFYQKRGFSIQNGSKYWKLDENLTTVINDYEVDYTLLTKPILNNNSNLDTKTIEVNFEFVNNPQKNFIEIYEFGTKHRIREEIFRFVNNMPDDKSVSTMVNFFVSSTLESDVKDGITDEESQYIQQLFGILLTQAAMDPRYKVLMQRLAGILIGVLLLKLGNNENKICAYLLRFNEEAQIMDIASSNSKG